MHDLLVNIAIALLSATVVGYAAYLMKQPVILGYLIAGALIGPEVGFRFVTDAASIETISEIGLILLLFIIGLEMDLRKIAASGKELLVSGLGQFLFCVLMGFFFFKIFSGNLDGVLTPLYLAIVCALSSTAIVVKLLYDKFELDTLPGRLTLGILIIQDLWAILVLAFQPNFSNPNLMLVVSALIKSLGLLGVGFLLSRFVLKTILESVAKSPEMVVAISISWCALMSGLAGAVGLSREMGALIAGVSVSSFPYSVHITAKTLPLRDFFLTLFFVSLGMKMTMPTVSGILFALVLVIFTVVSRFLTVYPLLSLTGAGRRTSFVTSINLAQISEFSLVIASLGIQYQHIGQDVMAVVIYAMAIASVMTSYMIKYNHDLYLFFESILTRLGLSPRPKDEGSKGETLSYPIVILGFHRGAQSLIDLLEQKNPELLKEVLVIDFNPEVLKDLKKHGVAGLFGDISSLDTLEHARIQSSHIILSTIPDMLLKKTDNLKIVKACRSLSPDAVIVATADTTEHSERLKKEGASEVLLPYTMAGAFLVQFLSKVREGN